ncbi:MAG: glycosyltransferase family 4 protein [Methanospirillaceae archaeon]|nr:glycosyltransferase family 4 protein [Methanospirillaceae archaeon]
MIVREKIKKGNIKHITFQDYAFVQPYCGSDPILISCHDLIESLYYNKKSALLRLNMESLKKADFIVTGSQFSKAEIVRFLSYPEEKVFVVYNGVNHSQYYPKPDKEILKSHNLSSRTKVILYVGSEEPRKNVNTILIAFSKVRERMPDCALIKVGNPQWAGGREEMCRLIDTLHLKGSVIFTGYVPEDSLPLYYNAADLFVFPSSYEGFGLPVLEAMACGCPVITSKNTSIPEVAGDAAVMVPPEDIDILAQAIERVLSDDVFRTDMIQRGFVQSKKFSWEKAAEQMEDVYRRVAAGRMY